VTFPHGECECRNGCQCAARPGPAAFTVVRDGVTMKVCTRCDFSSDRPTQKLLVTKDDDASVFSDYDILGAFVLAGMLDGAVEVGK